MVVTNYTDILFLFIRSKLKELLTETDLWKFWQKLPWPDFLSWIQTNILKPFTGHIVSQKNDDPNSLENCPNCTILSSTE